jgi:gamma-glutamylputrescine oxidase
LFGGVSADFIVILQIKYICQSRQGRYDAAMTDYTDTYYAQTLDENRPRPVLEETAETDVCIIGGGMAGLNIALSLGERGTKSIVLEGRRVGFGASGRNGGKVLAGFSGSDASEDFAKMLMRVDLPRAQEIFELTKKTLPIIRRRIADYKIDCDLLDGIMICSWYDDPGGIRAGIEFEKNKVGLNVEFWERERLREVFRTRRYYDGQFYPDFFHVHPLRYTRGLARAAESHGARIFEESMVTGVTREGSGVTVSTARGKVKANRVVYCTSAYSNGIEPRLERAAVRVSSYMMVTEAMTPEKLATAIRAHYGVYDTRWALDYYSVLPDNRIVWGGGVGINSLKLPANTGNRLLAALLKVYPQLEGIKVEKSWVGTMASTIHRLPDIGRFDENIWYATDFGNNGIGPTAMAGEIMASALAQGDETWRLFEPFGLGNTGGFAGRYAAQGIYRYWQLRDKVRQWKQERKAA